MERTAITRYESGAYYPKPPTLRKLAYVLDTTVDALISDDNTVRYTQTKRDFYSIIDTISTRRKSMGLKRIELARITGVPSSCIGNYENHKLTKQLENLITIANALGLEIIIKEKS